jgi:hypothetical protein
MAYRVSGYIMVENGFLHAERFFLFAPKGAKPKDYLMIRLWDFSTVM